MYLTQGSSKRGSIKGSKNLSIDLPNSLSSIAMHISPENRGICSYNNLSYSIYFLGTISICIENIYPTLINILSYFSRFFLFLCK